MKRIIIISLLTLSIYSSQSCNSDDSHLESTSISGNWYMVRYEHSTNGENLNFINDDIVWFFDEETRQLQIEFNFSSTTNTNYNVIYVGIDEGTYDYAIAENDGILNLKIGDLEFGNVVLLENELRINRIEDEQGSGNNLSTWYFEK